MVPDVTLRRATEADLDALLTLRVAMFRETEGVPDADPMTEFAEATRSYLARALPAGEFIAFVAEAEGRIVGTSGLVFFQRAPTRRNLSGRDAYILNMYTLPDWRGRGIAAALVERILDFLRSETDVTYVFLHAEQKARPVYTRAGFAPEEHSMGLPIDRSAAGGAR